MLSPILIFHVLAVGTSLTPGVLLFRYVSEVATDYNFYLQGFIYACVIGLSYFMYGVCLIFVVPALNLLVRFQVKPFKGNWYSAEAVPWYIHNALTYLVRYTFLEFLTPTPLNLLFYKMMGMKIGKGTVINSTNISDPCLIELGDHVTIGGSAHIMAHYGQKGILIVARTVIKDKATIGLKSSVFGDVVIGEKVLIPPHMVVYPKTTLEDNLKVEKV